MGRAYRDKNGKLMTKGGATLVLKGNKHYPGLGHNAVLSDKGTDYLVFHAYDATENGRPELKILPIQWKNGWPTISTPLE